MTSRTAEQQLYIHSGYTSIASGHTFETVSPANGNMLATVQVVGHEDVDRAVKSAQRGQKIWAATAAMERSRTLRQAVDILRGRNDELVRLKTLDTGEVYSETSTVDIATDAGVPEYYVGLIPTLEDSQIPSRETLFIYARRELLDVVAGIGAWNYPIRIVSWRSAPAPAAGNAMTFKPGEVIPFIALKLAEIYGEAGLSGGVSNVLPGVGAEAGQYLVRHPGIARVPFTDGVTSGKKVMADSAASSLREVTIELSSKSPLIAFDDTGLDLAADIVVMADFFSSGQMCTSGTCVFVPTKYEAAFNQRIPARVERIRAGDVFDPQANSGPLVSFPHHDNVLRYIAKGREEDTHIPCSDGVLKGDGFDNGAWVAPTVFTDCRDEMTIIRREIFGPVMSLLTYESEDEMIHRINDTDYDLAVDIVMADLSRTHRVTHQLRVGIR